MKKQTKKTAATPARAKGKAPPTANAGTAAPVRVRDIGKNCPPMLAPAFRAVRGLFQDAVDATRPLCPAPPAEAAPFSFPEWKADAQGIIPPPPIPPPPQPGAKVDPWRDKAREIVAECGWSWEALEENERQPCSRPVVGMGGAVYWALAHAVQLPPAQLEEAAGNLKRVLVAAAKEKDSARFCKACALFPETVRRLAESPAVPPTANANANPATAGAEGKQGKGTPTRGKGKPTGKRGAIGLKEAAKRLKVSARTLQREEADPSRVPESRRGYCRAVRQSEEAWDAWQLGLGMKEAADAVYGSGKPIDPKRLGKGAWGYDRRAPR